MDNLHAWYTDDYACHWNGVAGGDQESSGDGRGALASSQPSLNSVPSPEIAQTIFDRLNATIEQEQTERTDNLKDALDELGREIRQWRLQRGYTRGVLAGRLYMNVNQLICIENGIAQAHEISTGQLLTLKTLLSKGEAESLEAAIQQYLISLKE